MLGRVRSDSVDVEWISGERKSAPANVDGVQATTERSERQLNVSGTGNVTRRSRTYAICDLDKLLFDLETLHDLRTAGNTWREVKVKKCSDKLKD